MNGKLRSLSHTVAVRLTVVMFMFSLLGVLTPALGVQARTKNSLVPGKQLQQNQVQIQDDLNPVVLRQGGPTVWASDTFMALPKYRLYICRYRDCLNAFAGENSIIMSYSSAETTFSNDIYQWRWAEYGKAEIQTETRGSAFILRGLRPHTIYIIKAQIYTKPGFWARPARGVGWIEGLIMTR